MIQMALLFSDFTPTVAGNPPIPPSKKNNTGLIVGVAVSVGVVSMILICSVLYIKRKASYVNEDEGTASALLWNLKTLNSLVIEAQKIRYNLFYHMKDTTFYKMKWTLSKIVLIFRCVP